MTHLTIEQLLATREPGLEPHVHAWREHAESCDYCRGELDRLDQRVARLKALPGLQPSRDLFGSIRTKAASERRSRQIRRIVGAGLALAASVTLVVAAFKSQRSHRRLVAADPELAEMMSQSKQLERALAGFDQDRQVVDGRTVAVTSTIEDKLARVDREIEAAELLDRTARQQAVIRLWRERVGLLDALVDVHLTGARYVGF